MLSNIKTVVEEQSHQRMYSYILLVDDHDEVGMYLPSTNKLVSTNQRAN